MDNKNSLWSSTNYALLFLASLLVPQVATQTQSLRHLFLVFRHGDRAPISLYPNDPNPESFWKEGLGQLTNLGKEEQYQLGKYLRQRYDGFLTDDMREAYVRSSAVERCLESAACNLASLYQPENFWVWRNDLKWQPIPIQTMPLNIDPMLTTGSHCPEADREMDRIRHGHEAEEFMKKHQELFDAMTNYTGEKVENWTNAGYIVDVLFIEKLYNLTIPAWVEPLWDEMWEVFNFGFYIDFSTQLMQRLRGGSLVGDIVSTMEMKVQKSSAVSRKVNIYSTHDVVISAFLSALGVYNKLAPPYFATVLVELHENGPHNHTVRVLYRNDTTKEPYQLTIPGCDFDCPLGQFVRLTEDVIPVNWKEECGLNEETKMFSNIALVVIISMGVLLFLLLISMSAMCWLRCQKEKCGIRYHRVPELNG